MRTTRTIVALALTASIIAIVVAVSITTIRNWPKDKPPIDPRVLVDATTRFAHDCREKGRAIPPAVTLSELVGGGYLPADFTNGLAGTDITFYTDASEENPQNLLMSWKRADGTWNVILGDGSIQQVTEQRFRQALRNAASSRAR